MIPVFFGVLGIANCAYYHRENCNKQQAQSQGMRSFSSKSSRIKPLYVSKVDEY